MTTRHKIVVLSAVFGLLFGAMDALIDVLFFYEGSFPDLFYQNIPPHEIYVRTFLLLAMITFGMIVGWIVEKKEIAEANKKASEEKFRALVESTAAVPWEVDVASKKFTYVGRQVEKVFGYPIEKWTDFDFWASAVHPEDRDYAVNFCMTATGKSEDHEFVYRMFREDGSVAWVRDIVFVETRDGQPAILRGFFFDVTRLKEAESGRAQLEMQLRQAQKMEAIGQLAGGVAHDFNNYLTTIIGYGDLLMIRSQEGDPAREGISQILAAAEKAAMVTRSLLAFSRKQVLDPRPVSLNAIIQGMTKLMAGLLGEEIQLEIVLPDQDVVVIADPNQIEQVVLNMAANAKDAMPGGGNFTVEVRRQEVDAQYVKKHGYGEVGEYGLLVFSDDGDGMGREAQERIFEPFYTTKGVGKGTGLGLAIVHGIVKQHEGYINVYSEQGHGTTFNVMLPAADKKSDWQEGKRCQGEFLKGTETLLVAEDEQSVRKLLAEVLHEAGYEVITAEDGFEAVEKYRELGAGIGMVVLDVIMPKKDGREVLDEIRKINPGVKHLFVSGYTADIIHKKGIIDRGAEFLPKPISPSELLKRVRGILDSGMSE